MDTLQQAQAVFGVAPANGIFGELLKRVGPSLAQILLDWLLTQRASAPQGAAQGILPEGLFWSWAKALIKDNRDQIVTLLEGKVGLLVDLLLANLD